MLTNLTRFYRMTLRKSKDLISIRDELTIAQLYLEMEKLCHNDNLTWEISVKESRGQPKSDALKQVTCKGNF